MLYAEFPLGQNLSALNRSLSRNNIPHRFTEENGVQKLWLANSEHADLVTRIINGEPSTSLPENLVKGVDEGAGSDTGEAFIDGNRDSVARDADDSHEPIPNSIRELYRFDLNRNFLTLVFIALGFVGYLVIKLELQTPTYWLRFGPFQYVVSSNEYWRLLTPAFLHFSEMHVIFNCIWIWEVGKRLEIFLGKLDYFMLFLCCAIFANVLQFRFSGHINFGGLSGVVYGYFGCLFMLARRWKYPILYLPPAFYGFMMVMLVLGFSGVLNLFIDGKVANLAHLGGLIGGVLFGFLYKSIVKSR